MLNSKLFSLCDLQPIPSHCWLDQRKTQNPKWITGQVNEETQRCCILKMLTWKWHGVEPQVLGWVPIRQGSRESKELVPERSSSGTIPSLRDRKRSWNFHLSRSTSVRSTSVCLSLGFSWDSLLHLPKKNLRCFQNSFSGFLFFPDTKWPLA